MNETTIEHGTRHSYTRHKCRCEACRTANSAYLLQYRELNGKPIADHSNDKSIPHGSLTAYTYHNCRCKTCKTEWKAYQRKYRTENPEVAAAAKRRYRAKNRGAIAQYQREYGYRFRAENPDYSSEKSRRYYAQNRERLLAEKKIYTESARSEIRDRAQLKNELSREKATRNREPWTSQEDSVAMDLTLTVIEAAFILQRTMRAVGKRRSDIRKKEMA